MSSHTVLLVDGDRDTVSIYKTMLEHHGLRVLISMDGTDALRLLTSEQPDLVVMELLLPGIDGRYITRELKQSAETQHIPILVISSLPPLPPELRDLEILCDAYLSKPCSPTRMLQEVKRFLKDLPAEAISAA